MTVYVDDMYRFRMGAYRGMKMSHMLADSEEELHAMADKIGIDRRHYQDGHYDIAFSKRLLALQHGARPITMREAVQIRRKRLTVN